MVERVSLSGKIQGHEPLQPKSEPKDSGEFMEVLKDSLEEVSRLQKEADQTVQGFVTQGTGNIHDVFLAMEKADVSFRLVMRVRDKLLDAYQEIMRTQL
jgi:flagellar hook-basal body complex protein FliE